MQRGIENYRLLPQTPSKPSWAVSTRDHIPQDAVIEDLEEVESDRAQFDPNQPLPTSLMEVDGGRDREKYVLRPRVQMTELFDMYRHNDESC